MVNNDQINNMLGAASKHQEMIIKAVKDSDIDVEPIVDLVLKGFLIQTKSTTREFYKAMKAGDKALEKKSISEAELFRSRVDYVRNHIFPFWEQEVIVKDESHTMADVIFLLTPEQYIPYVFAIYTMIHSEAFKGKERENVRYIISQMCFDAAKKYGESGGDMAKD